MKIYSWNVNGLRACMKSGNFIKFIDSADADIICLQEIKMKSDQAEVYAPGYSVFWNSAEKPGYSGTALFTKIQPLSTVNGVGVAKFDVEGRIITAEYNGFYLVNVYAPNSQDELKRIEYRMEWEDVLYEYLKQLESKKPVVMCGDLNVAHKEIDLVNPARNRFNPGFTDREREKFSRLIDGGFIDTFRLFYPDVTGAYTWWSYIGASRSRNVGWRIDYFLASDALRHVIQAGAIHSEIIGSDHCPVRLDLL